MPSPADWLVNLAPRRNGRINLLCLPFAGGGSGVFRDWPSGLSREVNVFAARLPGRESRLVETPYRDLVTLVRALIPAVQALLYQPYVLFGHSMGALLGYELAQRLRAEGQPEPAGLIVSGRAAPHTPGRAEHLHRLPDQRLIAALRDYGGTPEALLAQPELLELFLPTIRADFQAVETYRPRHARPLSCPVTVFRGTRDADVTEAGCLAWSEMTTGPFAQHCFPGGHFFIDSAREAVLGTIGEVIAATRERAA